MLVVSCQEKQSQRCPELQPYLSNSNPYLSNSNPYLSNSNPYLSNSNPYLSNSNPYLSNSNPYLYCDKFEGTYWTLSRSLFLEWNETVGGICGG